MVSYDSSFQGKNVLITGGLGFIGSNLAIRLVDLGANVLLVDSLIPDYGGNLFNVEPVKERLRINIADVRDANGMNWLVRDQDFLFNLAGQISHVDSMLDPYTDLEINCRAQLSILEACRRNNPAIKVVYASTRQVYGKAEYLPVNEKHLLRPVDVNGINKMAGEWYHILYNNVYGIRTVSLRLTNTYGPRLLMKHNRQGFVAWFIRQAMDNQEIQLFGDGKQLRDLNYVDDVVEAMLLAAVDEGSNGRLFNLGNSPPVTLQEFVVALLAACQSLGCGKGGYRLVPFPADKKRIDIGDYYADYGKIRSVLGWEPRVSLAEGLRRTIEYYAQNREHYWYQD
ncbi:MAG TPA: NAD-dependent epimerase/dehydratase family protein [Anaerolineae bacterium]|nr:NAD-dependent epimerase/dehydratase family protein [Anaerolineae bacterium]HQJ50304.1 NAD-dependent epimerase/dehydratase family protein [Anaerolineae bacterium]